MFFYEFGYMLYGLFVVQCYVMFLGINMFCDFVEFFFQINEYWVSYLCVFECYVCYVDSGEKMFVDLQEKMCKVSLFNKGYDMIELFGVVLLDMCWYMLEESVVEQFVVEFKQQVLVVEYFDLLVVLFCYCSSYFVYIFGGGYVVGYYVYLWM